MSDRHQALLASVAVGFLAVILVMMLGGPAWAGVLAWNIGYWGSLASWK